LEIEMVQLNLNGQPVSIDAPGDTPLLWAIREKTNLTGTKFGCGVAQCGACTVHVDGAPTRSCVTPLSAVAGKKVTTIEGLVQTPVGKVLEAAWVEAQAPQCGYCQSGQMMTAASVLAKNVKLMSRTDILQAMSGNICRCGTYNQIANAVSAAQKKLAGAKA
jgi:isoquinoline 1-oxidoreductase alpha subunit